MKIPVKPRPSKTDFAGWVVLNPLGYPVLSTTNERRGAAIDAAIAGSRMKGTEWKDMRDAGFRVVRCTVTPARA